MDTELIPLEVMRDILGLGLVLLYFLIPTIVVVTTAATIRYYNRVLKSKPNKAKTHSSKPKEANKFDKGNVVEVEDSGNSVEVEVSGLKLDFDEHGKISKK
jgi:uncharacterized glyoxalase superfamily protein PhnB